MIRLLVALLSFFSLIGGISPKTDSVWLSAKTDSISEANDSKSAEDYYNDIPVCIRDAFENSDWCWYVYEDESLAHKYNYPVSIMGMTDWGNKEIVIDRRSESKQAIIHELGHWSNRYYEGGIDRSLLNAAYEAEWQLLYRNYGGSIKNYDSLEEFGASAFEIFVLDAEGMESIAPNTYRLFDSFVNLSGIGTKTEKFNSGCVNDGSYDFARIKYAVVKCN